MPTFELTPRQREVNKRLGGPQRHSLLYGGSRSGKTFLLVRAIVIRALRADRTRHLITRFHMNAVRASVGMDTLPNVLHLCFPELVPLVREHRQDGYFELPNGSQIWLGGLDEKDRTEKILGQEYSTVFCNEASQIPYASALVALTRLAQKSDKIRQRAYYDLNPSGTNHWTYRLFIEGREPRSMETVEDPENYVYDVMNPGDNQDNLDPEYVRSLANLPERQRLRFYEGAYVADIEGALWTIDGIERGRIRPEDLPELRRIVVGVDPSGASDRHQESADAIGIVVCGLDHQDEGHVLADITLRASPGEWSRAVVHAWQSWGADRVIAEANFGGAMVEHTIRTADPSVPVKLVTASRGKTLRAEPVAALYESTQDMGPRVHHVGRFPELEEEMANFSTHGYQGSRSPNRADAGVFALTELMLGKRSSWRPL